jgi:L-asparaginase II
MIRYSSRSAAALPDGPAASLKISDGAGRARQPVMVALLRRLGARGVEAALGESPVLGHSLPVGSVSPVV